MDAYQSGLEAKDAQFKVKAGSIPLTDVFQRHWHVNLTSRLLWTLNCLFWTCGQIGISPKLITPSILTFSQITLTNLFPSSKGTFLLKE